MAWPTTSKQSRGYGRDWEIKREQVLSRDRNLCQCKHCKDEDRTTIATQVDHIVSRAMAKRQGWSVEQCEHMSNLQAINSECHKRKTIEEKGWKVKPTIGLDGFPIG